MATSMEKRESLAVPTLAAALGPKEAILLEQALVAVQGSRHVYQARPWIRRTLAEWRELLPFWSGRTIARLLQQLERPLEPRGGDCRVARGPLLLVARLSGHFDANPWDTAKWYSLDAAELERIQGLVAGVRG